MYEGYIDKKPMRAGQTNLIQKLFGPKVDVSPTLISGLDQTKLAIGLDTSHWCGPLTKELIEGADWVSPKCTDGSQVQKGNWGDWGTFVDDQFHNTVQLCYEVGRPCIPYHFFQWNYDQWNLDQTYKFQFDIIKNAFRGLRPHVSYHGLALDLETSGDTSTNYQKRVEGLYNLLKADPQFADVPILFYSSNYYLNMYPALRDWLSYQGCDKMLWMAQWPYTAKWAGTWEQFKAQVLPTISMKVSTPGYANWTVVQWTASCMIEGFGVDVNSWKLPKDELYKWLNYKQSEQPPDDDEPPADSGILARVGALEAQAAQQARELAVIESKLGAVKNAL